MAAIPEFLCKTCGNRQFCNRKTAIVNSVCLSYVKDHLRHQPSHKLEAVLFRQHEQVVRKRQRSQAGTLCFFAL